MTYKLTNFLGINNRLPDSALHIRTRQIQGDYLKDAVNVDIDNAGRLLRRRTLSLVQAMAGAHSLHMTSDTAGVLVRDSVLYAITLPTYTETLLKILASNAAMSYVEYNGDLYYSNGTDSGRITTGVAPSARPPHARYSDDLCHRRLAPRRLVSDYDQLPGTARPAKKAACAARRTSS